MTDRTAFLTAFKRLTRDGTGNAVVPWRARDQTGAVLDHGMNNATAIWASRPDGSVIEIEVDGRWIPATSLPPTQETKTAPAAETGAATEEGQSAMDQMCAEAPELQEPKSDLHQTARDLAAAGWKVFPCQPNDKAPACSNGFHDASNDQATIDHWWTENPTYNVGLRLDGSGISVVDTDPPDGEDNWQALQAAHDAPETYTVRSPRGGLHRYFIGTLPSTTGKLHKGRLRGLAPHVDTKGSGGYVLAAPSVTPDGQYEVVDDRAPADVPNWIAPILDAQAKERSAVEAAPDVQLDLPFNISRAAKYLAGRPKLVIDHGSDEGAFILACELHELGISRDTALDMLTQWQPEFDDGWWEEKVNNGYRYASNGAGVFASAPAIEAFAGYVASRGLVADEPGDTAADVKVENDKRQPATDLPVGAIARMLHDVLAEPDRPAPEIVAGVLERGVSTYLKAPSKHYKSWLAYQVGVRVALGEPMWGRAVEKCEVVYLSYEDPESEIRRRGKKILSGMGRSLAPMPFRYLDLKTHRKGALLKATRDNLEPTPFWFELSPSYSRLAGC